VVVNCLLVVASVLILWKSADWFVEGAVGLAERLRVPPMLVGLVLVSMATTTPELMTSFLAALHDIPELALGNAIGSVVVNAGVALGLAAAVSRIPLTADPRVFRSSAAVLMVLMFLSFLLCADGSLRGTEGSVLLAIYVIYIVLSYRAMRRAQARHEQAAAEIVGELQAIESQILGMSFPNILVLFSVGLAGILLGSELLVSGAQGVALYLSLPSIVAGLTIAAIGTSIPEIATCVASALKGHSEIGIGNIIGANILNICWVAGVSSMANPLAAEKRILFFMFPAMIVTVLVMLGMLHHRNRLTRIHGAVLLLLYAVYLAGLFGLAPPGQGAAAP